MADEEDAAMELLGNLSDLIGIGMDIEGLFGGDNAPGVDEIAALVLQEMQTLFFQQSADAVISDAAARLDTVRQFLAIDYLNEQRNGGSNSDLWSLLDQSSSSPGIANLEDAQNALNNWLTENSGTSQGLSGTYLSRAVSVGLGLALHICLLHRERSKVAPDAPTSQAELADMQDMARTAIAQFQPAVEAAIGGRGGSLLFLTGTWTDHESDWDMAMTRIPDPWLANQDQWQLWINTNLSMTEQDSTTAFANQAAIMNPVYASYRKVLWDARPNDCTALQNGFPPNLWDSSGADFSNGDDFKAANFDNICAFGKWVDGSRKTLMGLDLTARGLVGQQEDDWHVCQQCNGVFHGLDDLPCPAGGVHASGWSPNLVLQQQVVQLSGLHVPGAVPPNSESNWAQCSQCHGVFTSAAANACASGGSHVAGTKYFMCTGTAPAAGSRGLVNAGSGFVACQHCGLLYFPAGAPLGPDGLEFSANGVCPAGGSHSWSPTTNQYWLSWIALWKGGVPIFLAAADAKADGAVQVPPPS